jgi:2-polyprenyl-3-methyl-5-hydroxy-6-metoxy-1,4-benzoquinol methylase
MGLLVGLQVLEVGCGRSAFAIELALRGASTTAIDFSPAAIEIARERAARANAAVEFMLPMPAVRGCHLVDLT